MKKLSRGKNVQPPKGNLKISSFFQKQVTLEPKNATKLREIIPSDSMVSKTSSTSTVIVIDSDNSQDNGTEQRCTKCQEYPKEVASTTYGPENELPDSKVSNISSSVDVKEKKRRLSSPEDRKHPEVKRKSAVGSDDADNVQNGVLVDFFGRVTVKTPDKLFPPSNLDEKILQVQSYSSSASQLERPTNLKQRLSTKDCYMSVSEEEIPQKQNISSSSSKKVKSPSELSIPLQNHDVNLMSDRAKKTPCKTPKKSPRLKLFDKSPKKLEEFNVQVIDNFVKITPSKSNRERNSLNTSGSISKKQSSILNYVSPVSSSSREAQKINETTPKKESHVHKQFMSPPASSKAKAKLDFSSCMPLSKKEDIKEAYSDITLADLGNAFDDWDITFSASPKEYTLDLQEPKHCIVLESLEKRNRTTIKVECTSTGKRAICHLEGFWISTRLKAKDTLYINASKDFEGNWIIDNNIGLLVYEPDLLISSTSIVRSVFCMRRSVLSEKYQGFEPSNRIMVIGILVHSLLQSVLKNNIQSVSEVEKIINKIVSSDSAVRKMYEASLVLQDVKNELLQFVPKIMDFIKHYVQKSMCPTAVSPKNITVKAWNGKIDSIDDIEENIWCPQLGIKGKVDVSIQSGNKIYPLEVKTGRASMSLEHKGQVILYIMMMNTLGYEITSGLLHYLREGILTEVTLTSQESRDLIILRNELVHFLTRVTKGNLEYVEPSRKPLNLLKSDTCTIELPEPIDNLRACGQCPYKIICSAYIPYENHDISSKENYLAVQKESLTHLQKDHLDYFIHWSFLLSLENVSHKDSKPLRQIYTVAPDERVKAGKCINDVQVAHIEIKSELLIEHTFKKRNEELTLNFLASGITENSYVVVSTNKRPAVASGFVTDITINSVKVSLERDLNKKYRDQSFHLDTYDSSVNTTFNMTSLALLLEDSSRSNHLRKIIIDKEVPTFLPKLPKIVAIKSVPILKRLNKSQQRAVLKSLSAKDYLLIKGMPGTGKTATIVALVQLLVEVNKTVLITSHTHSAIDNVCIRLKKYGVNVLRLGSLAKVDEKIKSSSEYNLTKGCKSPEELEEVYNQASVIAVTCLGSGHPLLSKRVFDVCLVDESTQVLQTSVVRPIYCAKTFILVGDPDQLAPVVRNKEAVRRGMTESLFERLNTTEACVTLNQNYRMNKTITALANSLTYNGDLSVGNDIVANACLTIPNEAGFKRIYKDESWLLRCLDTSLELSVQIIDTNIKDLETSLEQGNENVYVNVYEAVVIAKLVNILLEAGVSKEDIGVIATYRDQVAYISRILHTVDVSTVDQFQGKDKSIIFYSCTKFKTSSTPISEFNLLEDHRRLTVAVTRAKHKLIIIGELNAIEQYKPFAKILNSLDENKFLKLEEGELGFCWKKLLEEYAEGSC